MNESKREVYREGDHIVVKTYYHKEDVVYGVGGLLGGDVFPEELLPHIAEFVNEFLDSKKSV